MHGRFWKINKIMEKYFCNLQKYVESCSSSNQGSFYFCPFQPDYKALCEFS